MTARGNPCGVCTARTSDRSTVAAICSPSTCLRVSTTGTTGTAPPSPSLSRRPTRSMTRSKSSTGVNGLAASCTSTVSAASASTASPASTHVLPLGTADDCAAAARETGCFEHPLCLLQAICWHDDNCLLESRQLCNGLERALEHRSGADRHECLRRVSLQPRAAASGNDDDSNTHGCALGEGPTGPAPRRGSRWPCLRRPSWQAPARRRGSGGPSRACASRLPTGRGPGRDATGRGRPRSP